MSFSGQQPINIQFNNRTRINSTVIGRASKHCMPTIVRICRSDVVRFRID